MLSEETTDWLRRRFVEQKKNKPDVIRILKNRPSAVVSWVQGNLTDWVASSESDAAVSEISPEEDTKHFVAHLQNHYREEIAAVRAV